MNTQEIKTSEIDIEKLKADLKKENIDFSLFSSAESAKIILDTLLKAKSKKSADKKKIEDQNFSSLFSKEFFDAENDSLIDTIDNFRSDSYNMFYLLKRNLTEYDKKKNNKKIVENKADDYLLLNKNSEIIINEFFIRNFQHYLKFVELKYINKEYAEKICEILSEFFNVTEKK